MGTYRYSGEYIYPAEITTGILKTMEMSQKASPLFLSICLADNLRSFYSLEQISWSQNKFSGFLCLACCVLL